MMNSAFRFPASLSVTIGHHAVGGEGATLPSNHQIYIKNIPDVPSTFFFSQHSVVLREISGRDMNALQILFFMNLSHVMRWYYSCEKFVRVLHRREGFARICHICEKIARILHRCDKYVRNFQTCDRFILLSNSNESVTRVKNSHILSHV